MMRVLLGLSRQGFFAFFYEMSPMAHRVISRQSSNSVAFGAKWTLSRIYEYTALLD
jgi:hypothetical protein